MQAMMYNVAEHILLPYMKRPKEFEEMVLKVYGSLDKAIHDIRKKASDLNSEEDFPQEEKHFKCNSLMVYPPHMAHQVNPFAAATKVRHA